jgi:SAM-dependent methyltransferase
MDLTPLRRALERLASAEHPPSASQGAGQPPWSDGEFSERMLAVHLDDETHMASRAAWVIKAHVDWLVAELAARGRSRRRRSAPPEGGSLDQPIGVGGRAGGDAGDGAGGDAGEAGATDGAPAGGWRILDVTCGPGFYCHELARRGWPAVGVDFAPAALRFARETAAKEELACAFYQEDVTALPADLLRRLGPLAAVTFWFGEFHSLPRAAAADLLKKLAACLEPGGLLVLEFQPWDSFPQESDATWEVGRRSPFRDGLQLWLQEWSWDARNRAMVDVHWILDAADGQLHRFEQCHRAYDDDELRELLATAGLEEVARHAPITGCDPAFEFPVLVAIRK